MEQRLLSLASKCRGALGWPPLNQVIWTYYNASARVYVCDYAHAHHNCIARPYNHFFLLLNPEHIKLAQKVQILRLSYYVYALHFCIACTCIYCIIIALGMYIIVMKLAIVPPSLNIFLHHHLYYLCAGSIYNKNRITTSFKCYVSLNLVLAALTNT